VVPNFADFNMDVSNTASVGGPHSIRPAFLSPAQSTPAAGPNGLESPQDEVEFSAAARMLDRLQGDPQVRAERLAEIRAAIVAGTYETPEKMALAIERLLAEIGGK
jgi:negative regulator of flagellin synthesis FlgM